METTVKDGSAQQPEGLGQIILNSIKQNTKQYTMFLALLAIWAIFALWSGGDFLSNRNLSNLSLQTVAVAIAAIPMVLVIVAGHIDLSVGSVLGFLGAVCAMLMIGENTGFGATTAIVATLVVGLAVGAWHGFWIAYQKVPAFIVTLASQLAFRGLIIYLTGGQTQGLEMAPPAAAEHFKLIGQGYVPTFTTGVNAGQFHDTSALIIVALILLFWVVSFRQRSARQKYGFTVLPMYAEILKDVLVSAVILGFSKVWIFYLGIPWSVILVLALTVVFAFIAGNTRFGRHLYAIGGNPDAARLSGINVSLNSFLIFCVMGVMTAVCGIVYTSRLNAATTGAGVNMELDAIASAVIGGTSLMGGEGTIFGAIIGATVMSSLDNGMSLQNLDVTWQYVVKGLVLLLAVWVDMLQRKKS
jgi:D-xylose transport system permease protein